MKEHFCSAYFSKRIINGLVHLEQTTVFAKIMTETKKCLEYATINRHISDPFQIEPGQEIVAFLKNFRRDVIFCSLNIGVSGVIRDKESREYLERHHSFGDLVYVTFLGFEGPKRQARLALSWVHQEPSIDRQFCEFGYHTSF